MDDRNDLDGNGLSQKLLNAIALLLQGLSDAEVGQQVGVDRVTVFRWRRDEVFAGELEYLRRVLLKSTMARVHSLLEPSLDILQKHITGDDPKMALRAAAILLRIATPARPERTATAHPPAGEPPVPPEPPEPTFMQQLDAYINAPMPDEPGHPAYERARRQREQREAQKAIGQSGRSDSGEA